MSAAVAPQQILPSELRHLIQARIRALIADFSAISPVDLADATREILDEMSSRAGARSSGATAQAILRGHAEKESLKTLEGGHLSADEARAFLKLSKPALLDRFKKGRLLGWREKNAVRFPVWQFGPAGGLLPGLEETLAALRTKPSYDDWAKVLFFLNPRHSLGEQRPLDLLRQGRLEAVLQLASLDD